MFPVSTAADVKVGALARMCQACYLSGRVHHYNQLRSEVESGDKQEFRQLDSTIRSLLNLSYIEGEIRRMAVCSQTSICYM